LEGEGTAANARSERREGLCGRQRQTERGMEHGHEEVVPLLLEPVADRGQFDESDAGVAVVVAFHRNSRMMPESCQRQVEGLTMATDTWRRMRAIMG